MDYPPEALTIGPPAQIGTRIDGSRDGLPKKVWRTQRQDTSQRARQADSIYGHWGLTGTAPNPLVGVGKDGVAHFGEARALVGAVFLGDLLRPEKKRSPHRPAPSRRAYFGSSAAPGGTGTSNTLRVTDTNE